MEHVPCDLCGADDAEVLYVLPEVGFGLPGEFPIVRCRLCGLIYVTPRPSAAEIGAYYPSAYGPYRCAVEDEPWIAMRWARRQKLVARLRRVQRITGLRQDRLLDVGCATGLFIHEAARHGWQVEGVDISPDAAAYARKRFGLTVHQGTLESVDLPAASYDVITFGDVIEHTFSPLGTLRRARHLLRPGGWVILTIPNWDSWGAALFGPHWNGFDVPRHLYVFTRPVMVRALETAGFDSVGHRCYFSGYFAFRASLRRWLRTRWPQAGWRPWLERVLDVPGIRFPLEPLFWLADRLGRGPAITFWARRLGAR